MWRRQQIGDVKKSDLPGIEALAAPGMCAHSIKDSWLFLRPHETRAYSLSLIRYYYLYYPR